MGKHVAVVEEKFVVGETVTFCRGEGQFPVEVVGVDGNEVQAIVHGDIVIFAPRADGKFVALGSPEFAVMPDMIVRPEPVIEKPLTFWQRITAHVAAS